MSKRFRLFLILASLVVSGWYLYPTANWYFFTSEAQKKEASLSLQGIRDVVVERADKKHQEIIDAARTEEGRKQALPADLSYLIEAAKKSYSQRQEALPSTWTYETLLKAFDYNMVNGQPEYQMIKLAIQDHLRQQILAVKSMKTQIIQLGLDLSGGMSIVIKADMKALESKNPEITAKEKEEALDRAVEIITSRIDQFGVAEPQIKKAKTADSYKIYIDLPGDPDRERVKTFLQGKGSLYFSIVDEEATKKVNAWLDSNPGSIYKEDNTWKIRNLPADLVPAGLTAKPHVEKDQFGLEDFINFVVVSDINNKDQEKNTLDGNYIKQAYPSRDDKSGQPTVHFTLSTDSVGGKMSGADLFLALTTANQKKRMAVVMDEKVRTSANITGPIAGGSVQVTGFDRKESDDLAKTLRTGALPVPLLIESVQSIGASLGKETQAAGINSSVYGFILVALFMLLYYRGSGINADIALILNVIIIVAVMSVFNLTLTLTSIASLVLTVGISVDANVVVFERIKEEYLLGKSPAAAVDAGFKRAFWTVMDSHVTALIAAFFLSQMAKGPIQGFAVTLTVGLLSSLFTALFVSRFLYDVRLELFKAKKLSIMWRKV